MVWGIWRLNIIAIYVIDTVVNAAYPMSQIQFYHRMVYHHRQRAEGSGANLQHRNPMCFFRWLQQKLAEMIAIGLTACPCWAWTWSGWWQVQIVFEGVTWYQIVFEGVTWYSTRPTWKFWNCKILFGGGWWLLFGRNVCYLPSGHSLSNRRNNYSKNFACDDYTSARQQLVTGVNFLCGIQHLWRQEWE
jgi:hypothetical protein